MATFAPIHSSKSSAAMQAALRVMDRKKKKKPHLDLRLQGTLRMILDFWLRHGRKGLSAEKAVCHWGYLSQEPESGGLPHGHPVAPELSKAWVPWKVGKCV